MWYIAISKQQKRTQTDKQIYKKIVQKTDTKPNNQTTKQTR